MRKKAILISGSPRANGNTMRVLKECEKIFNEYNIETEIISLARININACSACYKCEKDIKCSINDDVNDIINKIKLAQGLIIAGPIYFGTMRGDLLNLIQRIGMVSLCSDNFLNGKVGGPIVIARHGGYKMPVEEILSFYDISDIEVPNTIYKTNIIGRLPGEALNDKRGMKAVLSFIKDVAEEINKKT